jgi:hypothetical protein
MKMKKIDWNKPLSLDPKIVKKHEVRYLTSFFDDDFDDDYKQYFVVYVKYDFSKNTGLYRGSLVMVDEFGLLDNHQPFIYNAPVEVTRWFNVYKSGPGSKIYMTEEEAKKNAIGNCLYLETRSYTYSE